MVIAEFNELFVNAFRLKEYKQTTNYFRFFLEEWCPALNAWHRKLPVSGALRFVNNCESMCDVPERVFNDMQAKCAVVQEHKHGKNYFSGESTEEVGLALLLILKDVEFHIPQEPEKPTHRPEEFKPNSSLRIACDSSWAHYERDMEQRKDAIAMSEQKTEALKNRDLMLAWQTLHGHVELVLLTTVGLKDLE